MNKELLLATQAKANFFANMSHGTGASPILFTGQYITLPFLELRTPMNGILALSADLLENGHSLSQADRESVQIIQDCADHLLNLLNDLLEFSSIESGSFKLDHFIFSVPEQIVKVANIFAISAKKKNISVETVLHMDRPYRKGT